MISDSCPAATLICGTLRLCLGRAVNKSMHDEDLHRPSVSVQQPQQIAGRWAGVDCLMTIHIPTYC